MGVVAEEVTMSCEVSKPDQKVQWLKDGKPIRPDRKTKMTSDGKVHRLSITKSDFDDAADYTAKVGDETTTGKLKMVDKGV